MFNRGYDTPGWRFLLKAVIVCLLGILIMGKYQLSHAPVVVAQTRALATVVHVDNTVSAESVHSGASFGRIKLDDGTEVKARFGQLKPVPGERVKIHIRTFDNGKRKIRVEHEYY